MNGILRQVHPRPDRVRDTWQTLNGPWSFAFDWNKQGKAEQRYRQFPAEHQEI